MDTPREHHPHRQLVQYDLQLTRHAQTGEVVASVGCAQRGRTMLLDECARCPRFVRVDVHEAGYTVCCQDGDAAAERG